MSSDTHLDPNAAREERGNKGTCDFLPNALNGDCHLFPEADNTYDLSELKAMFECESCGAGNSYVYPSVGQLCSKCGFAHTDDGG